MTVTAEGTRTSRRHLGGRLDVGKLLLEGRAFFALVVVIVVFSLLSPNYLTVGNVLTMSSHVAIYALLALGQLLVILHGGIDLSVGSTLGLSGIVAGWLMGGIHLGVFGTTMYPAVWVVVIICCLVGAVVGLVNGVLVARLGVAPFVATLGTLYAVRGLALLKTNGLTYDNLAGDPKFGNTGFDWLGYNNIIGIPVGVVVMVVIALGVGLMLSRSVFGRWLYSTGGNERAAELSGVPVRRVKVWVYVISGVCSAIAGLILSSELTSAGPTAGTSYELTAIAAVVIGGAALTGGRGTVRGTLLGAFVIGFLSDGLVIIGISSYWQTVFTGAVIVVAVLLNTAQYGRRRRRRRLARTGDADGEVSAASTSPSAGADPVGPGNGSAPARPELARSEAAHTPSSAPD